MLNELQFENTLQHRHGSLKHFRMASHSLNQRKRTKNRSYKSGSSFKSINDRSLTFYDRGHTLRSQSSGFSNLNLSHANLTFDLSWLDHPPSPSSHLQILMSSANIAIHRRSCVTAVVLDLQQTSPPSCRSHGDLSALLCQHRAILLLWYMLQYLWCII